MLIIGCDFHTRYQQIAMLDEATGELTERRLLDKGNYPSSPEIEATKFLCASFSCRFPLTFLRLLARDSKEL